MIPKVQLTSKGAALLAKVPAGEAVPVTRWQIGTGALSSGESLDRAALVTPYDHITVSEITEQGNRATVLGQFTNVGRPEFDWEELGLLATDPDEGEILMCYGNAYGDGERIQAGTEQLREFIFGTVLIFSGTASVSAVVDTSLVFIPKSEKGKPNGVASLGPDGRVPTEQLPDFVIIGGAQPWKGPVLWFDTGEGGETEEILVPLDIGSPESTDPIHVVVDGASYGVKNASLDGKPQNKKYDFKLI